MGDTEDEQVDERPIDSEDVGEESVETLRREVEEKYDFENFGPKEMAEMSLDEWEAAFDPETWIVGRELLDRVERDLKSRIATRDVFAVVERFEEGGEERLVAYSDEGYAVVYPDGSVEGRGTVLRDVKPTVALASMENYDVGEPPADFELPSPEEVASGTGALGNTVLQVVASIQVLAGLGILVLYLFSGLIPMRASGRLNIVPPVASLFFLAAGVFLFFVVANARLSDRFRAEEYRSRLRALGVDEADRPEFLPVEDAEAGGSPGQSSADSGGDERRPPDGTDRVDGTGD